jgi:hypothetical protein
VIEASTDSEWVARCLEALGQGRPPEDAGVFGAHNTGGNAAAHRRRGAVAPRRRSELAAYGYAQNPGQPSVATHSTETLSRPMYCFPVVPSMRRVVLAVRAVNCRRHVVHWGPASVGLKGPHVV